jgi:hypothetical protein
LPCNTCSRPRQRWASDNYQQDNLQQMNLTSYLRAGMLRLLLK